MPTLMAASAAALSAVLAMSPQSSTPNACLKLRMHVEPLYAVDIGLVRGGIVWDTTKITRAQFESYIQQERKIEPKTIFVVHWDNGGLKDVESITNEIRAGGFEVAMNCPPVPL